MFYTGFFFLPELGAFMSHSLAVSYSDIITCLSKLNEHKFTIIIQFYNCQLVWDCLRVNEFSNGHWFEVSFRTVIMYYYVVNTHWWACSDSIPLSWSGSRRQADRRIVFTYNQNCVHIQSELCSRTIRIWDPCECRFRITSEDRRHVWCRGKASALWSKRHEFEPSSRHKTYTHCAVGQWPK